jgi:hypothetical protein
MDTSAALGELVRGGETLATAQALVSCIEEVE